MQTRANGAQRNSEKSRISRRKPTSGSDAAAAEVATDGVIDTAVLVSDAVKKRTGDNRGGGPEEDDKGRVRTSTDL